MFSIALLALASCSEDVTIAEDVDVAAPNEETVEVIKNDIIFDSFEILGRSIDVEFDGEHIWVAHYEDSKVSKLDVDGNVLKVVDVDGEPIKITFDGEFLWIAHFTEPIVSKLNTEGDVIGVYDLSLIHI